MPYLSPTFTELKQQVLSDIQSSNFITGGLLPKSVLRCLAYSQAEMGYEQSRYIDWIALQATPFTATGEYLQAWAGLRAIYRIDASYSHATVAFTGTVGTNIPVGTLLNRSDGIAFTTDIACVVPATVPITSTTGGAVGNADSGVTLTLSAPIVGASSAAITSTATTLGTDQETDDSLRTRMLEAYASPAEGGSSSDYHQWSLAVAGISRCWVNPCGAGAGTVVLYCMADVANAGQNGFLQGVNGVATAEKRWNTKATGDQLRVANILFPKEPVTALVFVCTPSACNIPITISGLSPSSQTIKTQIGASLASLYLDIGSPLGMTIYPSQISSAIQSAIGSEGVFTLASPSLPVTLFTGQIPVSSGISYS